MFNTEFYIDRDRNAVQAIMPINSAEEIYTLIPILNNQTLNTNTWNDIEMYLSDVYVYSENGGYAHIFDIGEVANFLDLYYNGHILMDNNALAAVRPLLNGIIGSGNSWFWETLSSNYNNPNRTLTVEFIFNVNGDMSNIEQTLRDRRDIETMDPYVQNWGPLEEEDEAFLRGLEDELQRFEEEQRSLNNNENENQALEQLIDRQIDVEQANRDLETHLENELNRLQDEGETLGINVPPPPYPIHRTNIRNIPDVVVDNPTVTRSGRTVRLPVRLLNDYWVYY